MTRKTKKALSISTALAGILGFVLFRWTPITGIGILAYAGMFAVLAAIVIVIGRKHEGYWPGKDDTR